MRYRICAVALATTGTLWAFEGIEPVAALADEQAQEISASFIPGWNQTGGVWYRLEPDGTLHREWLQTGVRSYYMDEIEAMVAGWREADRERYYLHKDGDVNLGEPILGNEKCEFSTQGALVSAGWMENTSGRAYDAGCYDHMAQDLSDQLNGEKKYLFFEGYSDREDEYNGDMYRVYDRYAGFQIDMTLNEAADYRLGGAMVGGYTDDRIPGKGTINDCLSIINYRRSASCLELHVRGYRDASEAFDKIKGKLDKRFQSKTDRKYSLEHYHGLGMTHREEDGKQYFVVILIRRAQGFCGGILKQVVGTEIPQR